MKPLEIELLGHFRLIDGGVAVTALTTPRMQALLAYLALHAGPPQPRAHVASRLWPDSTESQSRTNLRQLLHHVRSAWPSFDARVEADALALRWSLEAPIRVDVAAFEEAVRQAEEGEARADGPAVRTALGRAADVYRGELLPGVYDEWLLPVRERLQQMYEWALDRLVHWLERDGDLSSAIRYAERLVAADPLRETSYQRVMRLHAMRGDRAAALRAYHQCATVLRRELEIDPSAATQQLRDRLVRTELDASTTEPPAGGDRLASEVTFVGREPELARLLDAWRSAAEGRATLALVTGEAGIGKTRLIEEVAARAARQGASVARARCYAAEGRLAYTAVADWLRSDALREGLAELPAAHLSEISRVLPELLVERPAIGAPRPFGETWQRRHFFEALARPLQKARGPLLLLIDDLQWCDTDTLEWLHYLLRLDARAALLVLGAARHEEMGREHPLTASVRDLLRNDQACVVPLGPLDSEETRTLAGHVMQAPVDGSRAASLHRETQGSPLFVIETLRAALTGPATAGRDALGTVSSDPSAIPPKIHHVLEARLAQLSEAAFDLAGLAAVIGQPFHVDLLARVSGQDEDVLVRALDELWQRRIVRAHERDAYDFTHDRLREVAFESVGPARRSLLHDRIAQALESIHASDLDAVSARIAGHYEHAGRTARAIPYFLRAASLAQKRCADTDAVGHLQRALGLLETLPPSEERDREELALLASLGPSLLRTAGYAADDVGRVYGRARLLAELAGDEHRQVSALWGSWVFHIVRSELEVAHQLAERFCRLAERLSDPTLAAAGDLALGSTLFHLADFDGAGRKFEAAASSFGANPHRLDLGVLGADPETFAASYASQVLWLQGLPDRSRELSERTVERARTRSHPFSLALALDYAAMLHQFLGDAEAVAARALEAAALCEEHGFRYYLAWTPILLGWAEVEQGRASAGIARIMQGLAALDATSARLRLPYYRALLASALGRSARPDEGLSIVATALSERSENRETWSDAELYRTQGDLLRQLDRPKEAEASYSRALEWARRQGARSLELRAATSLASVWRSRGEAAQAGSLLSEACARMRDGFGTRDYRAARSLLDALSGAAAG